MIKRIRRWLFNLWLDHWYLPRHPYHTATIPLLFLYRQIRDDMRVAFRSATEEGRWFRDVPSEAIQPAGRENVIAWSRA